MFKAQIMGRLGKDAVIYESSSTGTKFLTFTLAVNTKNLNDEKTYWIDVRSFNPNHLKLVNYLTKGKALVVGGDFNTGTITDKTGTVRITHSITCDYITFPNIGGSNKNENSTNDSSNNNVRNNNTCVDEDDIRMGNVPVPVSVSATDAPISTPEPSVHSDSEDELPF